MRKASSAGRVMPVVIMWVASSMRGQVMLSGSGASSQLYSSRPACLYAARAAYLAVALAGVHVAYVEQRAGHLDGNVDGGAGLYLLNVEVAAPLSGPCVCPACVGGRDSDYTQHGFQRKFEVVAPVDEAVAYGDYLLVVADCGRAQPAGHCARASAEPGESERLGLYVQDVDCEHLAGFGAVDVDRAAGRIAASQRGFEPILIGVALYPGAAIHLGYDLELLARVDEHGGLVVGAGLEVENVFGGALHQLAPLPRDWRKARAPSMNMLVARAESITSSAMRFPAA